MLGDMVLPLCDKGSVIDVCTGRAVPSDRFCFFRVGANSQGSLSRMHRLHGGSAGASTPKDGINQSVTRGLEPLGDACDILPRSHLTLRSRHRWQA